MIPNKLYITFYIFSLLCSDYIANLIKKLELCLTVVSILLKIRFGHIQISAPKIGIPMLKTACINPCLLKPIVLELCKKFYSFVFHFLLGKRLLLMKIYVLQTMRLESGFRIAPNWP